jgi:hypothetical protein
MPLGEVDPSEGLKTLQRPKKPGGPKTKITPPRWAASFLNAGRWLLVWVAGRLVRLAARVRQAIGGAGWGCTADLAASADDEQLRASCLLADGGMRQTVASLALVGATKMEGD